MPVKLDDQLFLVWVGEWANRNFTVHHPLWGMQEELGEAVHCLLKRAQGIRGYDNPDFFKAEFSDALADICVFAGHFSFLHPTVRKGYSLDWVPTPENQTLEQTLALTSLKLAELWLSPADQPETAWKLSAFLAYVAMLAHTEQLDLRKITYLTFEKTVAKRDWVKSPEHGDDEWPCRGVKVREATEKEIMEDDLRYPFRHLSPVNPTRQPNP